LRNEHKHEDKKAENKRDEKANVLGVDAAFSTSS
jgi:hypothetical protein